MTPVDTLQGCKVVVTRPRIQSADLASGLRRLGAEVIELPAIRIQPRPDLSRLDHALGELAVYDWVVFTSVNGVEITWERLPASVQRAFPSHVRLAAIGPATGKALAEKGRPPDFTPAVFVAEALAEGLPDVEGRRILLPRAAGARKVLPQRLQARGAMVDEIEIYDSLPAESDPAVIDRIRRGVDILTFTSPSTVYGTVEILSRTGLQADSIPGNPIVACIGPVTAAAAEEANLHPAIVSAQHDIPGLLAAIAAFVQQERSP